MQFDSYNIRNRYRKNPLLSQYSSSLPTDIKEMFKWMEFIIFNSPIASAGLKKLSETPVTSFRYFTDGNDKESTSTSNSSWKHTLEKDLKLKPTLLNISYNTLVYGNQFLSVYTPFARFLKCKSCGELHGIESATRLSIALRSATRESSFSSKKSEIEKKKEKPNSDVSKKYNKSAEKKDDFIVSAYCKHDKRITVHTFIDKEISDASRINVVQWNPYQIKIATNQISGKSTYYYSPDDSIISGVKKGDPEIINSLPTGMINAVLKKKVFKFNDGHLYHLKRDSINGISTAWGLPALSAAIPAFLNSMILRRANEKIASDYLVPLRVAYPEQAGAGESIYNFIGGTDFVGKINSMIKTWKSDPSAVQVAPFPIGVQSLLGDGKMLSVYQELEQAEAGVATALGIPIEFIKGGLAYSGQGASLRLLENQMGKIISALNGAIEFIVRKVAISLKKDPIQIEMVPFKIIDDMQEKATIIQLAAQSGGISKATLMEIFNMDAISEEERTVQEAKRKITAQLELERYKQDETNSIEARAAAKEKMSGSGTQFNNLNQTALLAEADGQVQQIAQLQEGQRRSALDEMSKTNYILYSVVKARLDMLQNKKQRQQ